MKNVLTILGLLLITNSFAQTNSKKGKITYKEVKIESVAIEVDVDSAEELETTFTMEDIKEMLDDTNSGETVSFKITCNDKLMSNGKKSNISYRIEGNTDKKEDFLKSIEKIRESALNYYKNKN